MRWVTYFEDAMIMREVPSRIEVYTYLNPLDISSYRKIKAWSI